MNVACPSCSAEYPVNERRLPASGLKMRCPKCGSRFHVHPDGRTEGADDAQAKPAFPKPAAQPKPVAPKPAAPKPTIRDLDLDLPAPKGAIPKPPAKPPVDLDLDFEFDAPAPAEEIDLPAAKPAARASLGDDFDLDLPAPKAAPKAFAKKPIAPPVPDLALDLPPTAPPAAKKPIAPTVPDLDLDLPAPKASPAAKKPIAPAVPDLDLDLPAPKAAPAPQAKKPIAPPLGAFGAAPPKKSPPAARAKQPLAPTLDELDLPAPRQPAKKPPAGAFDLDLPAPRAARGGAADVAPAKPRVEKQADFDLDLPAPRGKAGALGELDLPAPRAAKPALADAERTPFDDLDLPAPRSGEVDLPAPRSVIEQADEAFGDLDLPMPRGAGGQAGFGDLDLPMPGARADLPVAKAGFGELDLPAPRGAMDLPVAKSFGDLDLPAPRGASDLPVAKTDGFGELDLPTPRGISDLPVARGDGFGDLDLPTPRGISDFPALRDDADLPATMGGLDLPVAKGADFGELDLPEPRASVPAIETPRDSGGRGGVGGTGYGELDLGGGGGADDMEFADIPQRDARTNDAAQSAESLPPPRVAVKKAKKERESAPRNKGRAAVVVAILLAVVLAGGGALALTPYGAFGMYFFDRFLPGAGDPAAVHATIARAEEKAASDRWVDLREARSILARARHDAGINRELLARSLVHEGLYHARFPDDAQNAPRASAIRHRLEERGGVEGHPELALALAADALREGNPSGARGLLAQARAHDANDPYVDLVEGEVALARNALPDAEQAFARAAEHGGGARAAWGLARVRLRGEDESAAREAIEAVLRLSPSHGDALMARASDRLESGEADEALTIARQVAGSEPRDGERLHVAPSLRARAFTMIGEIQERRGRTTQALDAFDHALRAQATHVPALLGAGRVLLGDRPADALARFDSVLQAGASAQLVLPNGRTAVQEAQLGSARADIALDRIQEAVRTLEQLAAARTEDAEVLLWLGHAERKLDPPNREAAEQHYRAAIDAARTEFPPYLALAELFLEMDRGTDAGDVLRLADERVAESAEMRLALGTFELRRNRLPEAIRELTRALELDPELPAAHFSLGVAYRRSGRLEEATQTFDRLSELDPGHPRLALERGLLFEARGESARAVESYQAALRETPDDMDLMLRLGAAQVAANQIDDAEHTLERVRQERPSSPEASHFMGRVEFARGRYAEALTHFRQAVELDPTRGEFHLYVAWAALENNQLGEALSESQTAIDRDPSLGEAYWVRAVVELRSGNPAEAITDLNRALELRPNLNQVYATMGDAYDQLGRLGDAIHAYETAVARVDDEGQWWWRLGRLRMDRGDRRGATPALSRATLLGDADTPTPGWLAAAHRLYADALRLDGRRNEAVAHYRRYLTLAPPGDIDRADVRRTLMDMGEVPGD